MTAPSDRITRGGKTLEREDWDRLAEAERILRRSLRVMQGSYNRGGVSKSAGTHDGGGAFDLSVAGMTEAQAIKVVVVLRQLGYAAWLRSPKFGWPARLGGSHIHAIRIDCARASAGAKQQVVAYRAGRNGLASRAKDPFPRPAQTTQEAKPVPTVDGYLSLKGTNITKFRTNTDVRLDIGGKTAWDAEQPSEPQLVAGYWNVDLPPGGSPERKAIVNGGVRTWFTQMPGDDITGLDGPWAPALWGEAHLLISRVWPHKVQRDKPHWVLMMRVYAFDDTGHPVDIELELETREAKLISIG